MAIWTIEVLGFHRSTRKLMNTVDSSSIQVHAETMNEIKHKTCMGYVQTCDGEITYDIQELIMED